MNILLVEPDAEIASATRQAFLQAGHQLRHARSAQQAVSLADALTPDVVVLEISLPHHNGIEFVYEFKSYADWVDVPIVAWTSLAPPIELLHSIGILAYFYKPTITPRRLLTSMSELVVAEL